MDNGPEKVTDESKIFSVLAYLWILCFVPFFYRKNDPYVAFHIRQGLVLLICETVLWTIRFLPVIGETVWILGSFLCGIASLAGIIAVLRGDRLKLPVIGDYADRINI